MSNIGFTKESILNFLINEGGKVEYHKLIKYFKHALSDSSNQEARILFKDFVNELAFVSQEENTKFLIIRPQFASNNYSFPTNNQIHSKPPLTQFHQQKQLQQQQQIHSFNNYRNSSNNINNNHTTYGNYSFQSSNDLLFSPTLSWAPTLSRTTSVCDNNSILRNSIFCPIESDEQPPQPPPRRKSLSGSTSVGPSVNKTGKIEEKLRLLSETNDEKEIDIKYPKNQEEKLKEIHDLTVTTPGRVKEHAQKLNRMASESEIKLPMPTLSSSTITTSTLSMTTTTTTANHFDSVKRRHAAKDTNEEDNDSSSLQPLDPLRRKWMIKTSFCDYNELVQLLKEDSKLANFKDITSGYTALHWAAKFGKLEVIKLIAGTYGVDPNVKNHVGQTPLHLAAIFGHNDVMDLLIKVYRADDQIRDYSGKLAKQYIKVDEKENLANLKDKQMNGSSMNGNSHIRIFGPSHSHNEALQGHKNESVTNTFMRIGSLNTKMRKTAIALTGIKNWGSAESLNEKVTVNQSPIKYNIFKKKKSKKNSKYVQDLVLKLFD